MANAEPWYVRYPARYQAERDAMLQRMAACRPEEICLKDGRRGFRLELTVPDPEGEIIADDGARARKYTVLLAWEQDHPHSASMCYGGSVRCYFLQPSAREMEQDYWQRYTHNIPHMFNTVDPLTGEFTRVPDTVQLRKEPSSSFTIVSAVGLVNAWLCAYTASKYSRNAYAHFRGC